MQKIAYTTGPINKPSIKKQMAKDKRISPYCGELYKQDPHPAVFLSRDLSFNGIASFLAIIDTSSDTLKIFRDNYVS